LQSIQSLSLDFGHYTLSTTLSFNFKKPPLFIFIYTFLNNLTAFRT